jgi:Family of unknown function (DUF6232)
VASPEHRVLYQGRCERTGRHIQVTTRWCVAGSTRYPIGDLDQVGFRRGPRRRPPRRAAVGLAVVLVALLLTIVAMSAGWTRSLGAAAGVAVIATAAVTLMPAVAGAALRRPYEIWARYREEPVLLFATHDRQQHGQVARALIRAREQAE